MKVEIASALRDAMSTAGWPRTKVAYIAGVTEHAVISWLSGRTIPRGDKLQALREELPGFAEALDNGRKPHDIPAR